MGKRDYRVGSSLRTTGMAATHREQRPTSPEPSRHGHGPLALHEVKAVADSATIPDEPLDQSGSVLAPWLMALSHHDQRIVMSGLRGMDQGAGGANSGQFTKVLIHAIRQVTQSHTPADFKVDGHYLGDSDLLDRLDELVNIKKVRREIEHVSNHYLDHLLNPLYIIGRELGEPWRGWYSFLWKKLSFPSPDWKGAIEDQLASAV